MNLNKDQLKELSSLIQERISYKDRKQREIVIVDATAGTGSVASRFKNSDLFLFERYPDKRQLLIDQKYPNVYPEFSLDRFKALRPHDIMKDKDLIVLIHTKTTFQNRLRITSTNLENDLYNICTSGCSFIIIWLPTGYRFGNYTRFDGNTEISTNLYLSLDIQHTDNFAIISMPDYRRHLIHKWFSVNGIPDLDINLFSVPFNERTWLYTAKSLKSSYPELRSASDFTLDHILSTIENHIVDIPASDQLQGQYVATYDDISKRIPYQKMSDKLLYTYHWGQRKLHLSEVDFLTRYGNLSNTVVYAGAANGVHIKYLSAMFPNHRFFLYDPNKFWIQNSDKIKIFSEGGPNKTGFFTDDEASKPEYQGCLFISDIRRSDANEMVHQDNIDQLRWLRLMNVSKAMLKFRPPFPDEDNTPVNKRTGDNYPYIDGEIMLQCWAPSRSTETRLITDPTMKERVYSKKEFEEKMNYFNLVTRRSLFYHDVKYPGFSHSYDAFREVEIWTSYIEKFRDTFDYAKKSVEEHVRDLTYLIGRGTRGYRDFYQYVTFHKG